MQDLRDKDFREIHELFKLLGLPGFKAKETFRAVHGQAKDDISQITTLSLLEREKLKESYRIGLIEPCKELTGRKTIKTSFKLKDGKIIESVLMEYEGERRTVCVSSQAGCPIGCRFCATGKMGFKRNLTTGEILSQVYYFAKKEAISNVVFMGMGEPLLNYDNVIKAIDILNNELGQNIAKRKIVISTIGIISGIIKFSNEKGQVRLAWSLVAPNDQMRRELIGARNVPSIEAIVKALQEYQKKTGRRITIEYVVLAGVNDKEKDIQEFIEIAQQLDCHVNLIPFNPSAKAKYRTGNIEKIMARFYSAKIKTTVRESFGGEINAACGQLAA